MNYPEEYYVLVREIEQLEQRIRDLDSDYKILHECMKKLAPCKVLFKDMNTQCADIKKIFDKGTIEGRYDSCKITFNNKEQLFEILDKIVSATEIFNSSCEEVSAQMDTYEPTMVSFCMDIAKEAETLRNKVNNLRGQLKYHMNPQPPQ